ncbi:MAG TPA: ATP-binding protein, partial [Gammaproteobacteria bacterium]|nr:ATP-binding protein [Gammaproteobacteria bacterium]
MNDSLTLRVRSAIDAIEPASRVAEQWLHERGLHAKLQYVVNLAVEELVTNCIKHGYDDDTEHAVEFVLTIDAQTLKIVAVDDGREFDPSAHPSPDTALPAAHRPLGGLGIHLLRELTDSMSYERC